MYLRSLTLRGFKSFASATTLQFEPGITAVVGPNGSGKSNVVDALAWVMGEQGAKSLRGGKMEDVIFAGTSGRAPLGRAEVQLTIDNTDGALPIEHSEVTISRTMFRNGGSDYSINGHTARLLDVQELLSDSGIGREMHVIVGQGQLDAILQATPEVRRGFIEEAAGVLKHRKRKEKALRKLDSTEANLHRLTDLVTEIRRQLKPLQRQAEVARRAGVIQAELHDALARLLADDLAQATAALEADLADEQAVLAARARVETDLLAARDREDRAAAAVAAAQPRLAAAQEVWYGLAALRERIASTLTIAADRVRRAQEAPDEGRPGQDPDTLEAAAQSEARAEESLRAQVQVRQEALRRATEQRETAEQAHAEAEARLAAQVRAVADRREGLARLQGQVGSLRSRIENATEQLERLETAQAEAAARGDEAARAFKSLEDSVAGLDAGEADLDEEYEAAEAELEQAQQAHGQVREEEQAASQERAAAAARHEALLLGLEREDASAQLLAASGELDGLLGPVAALVAVEPGYEEAVSAALQAAADAVAVSGAGAATEAFRYLKRQDLGRAGLLLAGAPELREEALVLPAGARYLTEVVSAQAPLRAAVERLLRRTVVVDGLDAAQDLVQQQPELVAVTRDGDILSGWYGCGGSSSRPSLIQVQAAVEEAATALAAAEHRVRQAALARAETEGRLAQAQQRVDLVLTRLHESDARQSALAEQLGQLNQTVRAARGEAERLAAQVAQAGQRRAADEQALQELEQRLEHAGSEQDLEEPDPAERDALADRARRARSGEMEARLALRTMEERVRAVAGRAESLRQAAAAERQARARAEARREQLRREGETAQAVHTAAGWLLDRLEQSQQRAATEREAAEAARQQANQVLDEARAEARALAAELESLVDSAHRDELARSEQRMRIESLSQRALSEVGIEPETLVAEYGPTLPVPVLVDPEGLPTADDEPQTVPYQRDQQQKRLRSAQRQLQLLGRVNPLALEEFDAMQERHAFLSAQLDDLKRSRADLLAIVDEVDQRVQEVFAAAYQDVAEQFELVFARLFPGGEGRLVLTEPGSWLTTGVEVEARPAGKKVKRLSLLSGGERSLVAVAFLVSLFKARPSPFYILDEVEAALDDTNLGRLLEIYEELRAESQLLVITHQKRTMEVADALYGVTMRDDGVSTVISQRLRES
ncbi:MAG: chromosome segregation protein SMC [Actinomycetia bacterium]|nr:chromosome segregation protein SMC [Actinomycetes bacterium]